MHAPKCRITATFFDEKDGSEKTVQVTVGESMMEAAHANDVDLEGDAAITPQLCFAWMFSSRKLCETTLGIELSRLSGLLTRLHARAKARFFDRGELCTGPRVVRQIARAHR